jgi:hypothetical protein
VKNPINDQLDRIENKLDVLDSRLDRVDVRLAKYNSELEFHVARVTQVEDDLLPVAQHVLKLQAITRFSIWLTGTLTALAAIYWSTK